MAEHEIPFTRHDFLMQLAGDGKSLHTYFMDAVAGQLKSMQTLHGDELTKEMLYQIMQGSEVCYFQVPDYLADAIHEAIGKDRYRNPQWHGIRLVPTEREFIVAHIEIPLRKKEEIVEDDSD